MFTTVFVSISDDDVVARNQFGADCLGIVIRYCTTPGVTGVWQILAVQS